jgi:hypothetical protein
MLLALHGRRPGGVKLKAHCLISISAFELNRWRGGRFGWRED